MTCLWCDGSCAGADLTPLLVPDLTWLWRQVAAAADRRGDPHLRSGALDVRAAEAAEERAQAVGLLGGRALRPGQQRRVDLAELTDRVRRRGPGLTPGVVAAHAVRRRLASVAEAEASHVRAVAALRAHLEQEVATLPDHVLERIGTKDVWERLRRLGWSKRLLKADDAHVAEAQVTAAVAVLAQLPAPGQRVDRRTLVPGDPHALDQGMQLAALVLALADVKATQLRTAWGLLGVDFDDLVGGLLAVGVRPAGWSLPPGAVVTVPPRELNGIEWEPPPTPGDWAFVTENPSVVSAALDVAAAGAGPGRGGTVNLLCTVGTPSAVETEAMAKLLKVGWRVAVRADFDLAGLAHMRALLTAAPEAKPWRMSAADYRLSIAAEGALAKPVTQDETPWDPQLASEMTAMNLPAYEESLLPLIVEDLTAGEPGAALPATPGAACGIHTAWLG